MTSPSSRILHGIVDTRLLRFNWLSLDNCLATRHDVSLILFALRDLEIGWKYHRIWANYLTVQIFRIIASLSHPNQANLRSIDSWPLKVARSQTDLANDQRINDEFLQNICHCRKRSCRINVWSVKWNKRMQNLSFNKIVVTALLSYRPRTVLWQVSASRRPTYQS